MIMSLNEKIPRNTMIKFECTDPDCSQYAARLSDTIWSYIEFREYDGIYVVRQAEVNLNCYSLEEIWSYCAGYYESFGQMASDYGFRGMLQIIAECIFEQMNPYDLDMISVQYSRDEAAMFIHQWIHMYTGQL